MTKKSDRHVGEQHYVAALGWRALNRLYDPALRLTMPERRLRTLILEQASVRDGQKVLDVGSGTGSLLILLSERGHRAELVGVDGDVGMIRLAQQKAQRFHATLAWTAGLAFCLPFSFPGIRSRPDDSRPSPPQYTKQGTGACRNAARAPAWGRAAHRRLGKAAHEVDAACLRVAEGF